MSQHKIIQLNLKFFPPTAHTAEIKDYFETNFGKFLKIVKIPNSTTKKYEGFVRVDIEEPPDVRELISAINVTPFHEKTITADIFKKPPRPPMIFEIPDNPFPFEVVLNKKPANKEEDAKKRLKEKEAKKDREEIRGDDKSIRRRRERDDNDSDHSPSRRRRESRDRSPSRKYRDRSPPSRRDRDRSPHERRLRDRSPRDRRN